MPDSETPDWKVKAGLGSAAADERARAEAAARESQAIHLTAASTRLLVGK